MGRRGRCSGRWQGTCKAERLSHLPAKHICCGQNPTMTALPSPPDQPRNPLHGVTLEAMVTALHSHFGWAELALRIPVRCFTHEPSVNSSLKFLRKTPWAREKVEGLYLFMLREIKRGQAPAA
jgi:hypothetical protein